MAELFKYRLLRQHLKTTILKYINHEDLVDAKFKKMERFNR